MTVVVKAVEAVGGAVVDVVEAVGGAVVDVVEFAVDEIVEPVVDIVTNIVEDPRKLAGVALSIAFPGAGSALGASLGLTGTAATLVGQALINTAVNGGDVKAAVISAALPVIGKAGTDALSSTLASSGVEETVNTIITRAATQGATAAILGKDPLSAALLGGVTAGVNAIVPDIPGYNDLPDGAKKAVNSAIATKLTGGDVSRAVTQSLVNDAIAWAKDEVQKVPNAIKAAQATYKADTGETLSDEKAAELLGGYGADGLAAAADRLYTSESEAAEIWRKTTGTEPTEFDLMEIIGIDETQAGNIAYDRADTSTDEATDFFKSLYGADYEPTAEQLMELAGRPESAAKVDAQNLYNKDKNWVTEDEAEKFWKDMGNTGPVPQEFMDSMLMTTENGAKAMSEAHRINAEDIAATTFDGSQYKTPQEAAAAAKAAGFNAFTHKDKNLTYFTQPSPVEEANIRADVEEKKTFNEAFAAARKQLGAGKTFTWNGKQYTTNVMPEDTFDASRSSTITTAATLALANGKDKFIGPDGKTYKLDNNAKSVLSNSVNQSAAETQRLLSQAVKPATDETTAETQRLMESGTRGTMDIIDAMTAQALGTTQRGIGQFISNAGKTYSAMTGDLDFDNAAIKLGKEIETYAKGNDIYGLDVQKNRMSQAMARANETDDWTEKTKILGSAISENPIGFFDVAGSEVVEELPETVLQIGAALMTGGSSLGAMAAIGAAGSVMETFGSTVEDTYDKAKKAGFSDDEAMNKAYLNGVLSTSIEAGTNFVADKALLAPFLNKFTGTLAGTATGFVSSTTIGAASELVAGLSQSYATQYIINPETASLSKAATDGIFEMFIGGAAQGTMGLPGYAIQGGVIIGKDYSGRDVTMADVAAGAVLDSSTVNPNATIATSEDGDPVTLGGAMLQMPNYQFDISTLKTYVPQVFSNDSLIVGQDELGNTVTYGDLLGQTTESKGFDEVYKSLLNITPEQRTEAKYDFVENLFDGTEYKPTAQDISNLIGQNPVVSQISKSEVEDYVDANKVTEDEARKQFVEIYGYQPTDEEVVSFVGQRNQEKTFGEIGQYVDPRMVTSEEARAQFINTYGFNPSEEDISLFAGQRNQGETFGEIGSYVNTRQVTEDEARQYFQSIGYNPTDAEVAQFVRQQEEAKVQAELGQYVDTRQVTRQEAEKFFSDFGYKPTEEELATYIRQGADVKQDIIKSELEQYVDPRVVTYQEARDAYAALGLTKPTQDDVLKLVGQYDQTGLTDKATANLDSARYNSILDQLDSLSVGASQETLDAIDLVKKDLNAQITALGGDVTALQSGVDSLATGQKETQEQITGLGEQVDTRINELMQQGQTYQQATQQAIGELNTKNQQLQDLVGTKERQVTQADIDTINQMLGGQRDMDLTYDVTGDKQITQADIDFLTQVVSGTNTDWRAPVGSAWGATGLYGQLATNEAQRQADLEAQLAREQAAADEAARQAKISGVRGTLAQGQQTLQQAAQQLPQAYQQSMQVSTPIYGEMGPYLDIGQELDYGFFKPSPEKQAATKQQQTTKISSGGYIDDLLDAIR